MTDSRRPRVLLGLRLGHVRAAPGLRFVIADYPVTAIGYCTGLSARGDNARGNGCCEAIRLSEIV